MLERVRKELGRKKDEGLRIYMYGRVHRMKRMVKQVKNETRKKQKDAAKINGRKPMGLEGER